MKALSVLAAIGCLSVGAWLALGPTSSDEKQQITAQQSNNRLSNNDRVAEASQSLLANQSRLSSNQATKAGLVTESAANSRQVAGANALMQNAEQRRQAIRNIADRQVKNDAELSKYHQMRHQLAPKSRQPTNPYQNYSLPELGSAFGAKIVKVQGRIMFERNSRLFSERDVRQILYRLAKQRPNS